MRAENDRAKGLRSLLRENDPAREFSALDPSELATIQRSLDAAKVRRPPASYVWLPIAVAAAAALIVAIVLREERPVTPSAAPAVSPTTPTIETRMLFDTPGGTRVLWIVPTHVARSSS